jgi:hypothetical protein
MERESKLATPELESEALPVYPTCWRVNLGVGLVIREKKREKEIHAID